MSNNPLVSIIIPAFNSDYYIQETLDSILAQTYHNKEIIVVDDGSTDKTAQIIHGYGSKITYLYQKNSGGCAVPRNSGIENSSGEFLCFIDADDLMMPERIIRQVDFMKNHPEVGLVFCDYRNFNDDGLFPQSHFENCPRLWSQLQGKKEMVLEKPCLILTHENFGIAGTFFIRRNCLKIAAKFEPSLKSCEDFHFYFRLARQFKVGILNEVGLLRRIHRNNLHGNKLQMLHEGIRSRSMLKENEQDSDIRLHLNRYIAGCRSGLARYHADQGQYIRSFGYDLQVLFGSFYPSMAKKACKNIMRTTAMAIGLHRPKEQ